MESVGLMIAMQVAGTVTSGLAERKAGKRQKKLYDARAAALEADADATDAAGRLAARRKREEGRRTVATQRTMLSKSGVKSGEGSGLLVMEDTMNQFAEDAFLTRQNYAVKSSQLRGQAGYERATGDSIYSASKTNMITGLMTGGAALAVQGYDRGWFGGKKPPRRRPASQAFWANT